MRSLGEIKFRIGQIVDRNLDRAVPGRACVKQDGQVNLKHAALREIGSYLQSKECKTAQDRFFRSFADLDETRRVYARCFGGREEIVYGRARSIMNKVFPIFGRRLSYGNPVSWHFDPVSRKTAPFKFHSEIDYLNFSGCGDHKLIWELNRHQYMLDLARAYWLSGDERFLNEWVSQVEDWMMKNPPPMGINWASSLEIAYRSLAWIWCWLHFRNSRLLSDHFRLKFLLYLHAGGCLIEKNLSRYFSPNTHLTGEALGLFYLGLLFSGVKRAERWQKEGTDILMEQLDRHVRPDGTYIEQSTWYHKYTTDIYLHFAILLKANSLLVPSGLIRKIQDLLDFILLANKPDGKAPAIGDDDGGQVIPLAGGEPWDFRSVLSTGAVLFGRGDYKLASGGYSEETLWLLGPASHDAFSRLADVSPEQESAAFPDGGFFVMRNGWEKNSDYLMVDCGPHGWKNGGHAHSDLNSIIACVSGKDFLIDPGTYAYSESEWRNYFRTSQAHNTVSADGLSQSLPSGSFSWVLPGRPESFRWLTLKQADYFSGSATSYHYLGDPILHTREIVFLKEERIWLIRDLIRSGQARELSVMFHFPHSHVGLIPSRLAGGRFIVNDASGAFASAFVLGDPAPHLFMTDDWTSPVYSVKEPSKTGVCQVRAKEAVFVSILESGAGRAEWDFAHEPSVDRLWRADRSSGRADFEFISGKEGAGRAGEAVCGDGPVIVIRTGEKVKSLCLDCTRIAVENKVRIRFGSRIDHAWMEADGKSITARFSPRAEFEYESLDGKLTIDIEPEEGAPCAASADRP